MSCRAAINRDAGPQGPARGGVGDRASGVPLPVNSAVVTRRTDPPHHHVRDALLALLVALLAAGVVAAGLALIGDVVEDARAGVERGSP